MLSEQKFKLLMYYISIALSLFLLIPLVVLASSTINSSINNAVSVENGTIDLSNYKFAQNMTLSLQGDFIAYEYVIFTEELLDKSLLHNPTYNTLPTANLKEATTPYTYEFYVALNVDYVTEYDVVLCIPLVNDSVAVYINGVKVDRNSFDNSWGGSAQISYYSMREYLDENLEFQEFHISVNDGEGDSDLFKRDISISTEKNYLDYYKTTVILQVLLLGMMSISIVIAIIYFIFDPTNVTLTYLNIFDALLMTHILFNMTFVPNILFTMFNNTNFGDVLFRKIELFALIFAISICYTLNKTLFVPTQKIPKIYERIIGILYTVAAFAVMIKPELISGAGVCFMILLPILTASATTYKFYLICKQEAPSRYLKLFYMRMIFLNVILLLDIVTINQVSIARNLVLFGYLIIFSIHLGMRGIEYRRPFLDIQNMYNTLEELVEERTNKLKEANEILKNKSETDALTGIYNRFIFEKRLNLLSEEINLPNSSIKNLHLCIFDVDNFKRINDTYGHPTGDEQLIELATTTSNILPEDVLFARIGGEEFALLFKDYEDAKVVNTVEEIRCALEVIANASDERATSSFGITKAVCGTVRKEFYINADNCLYYSKTHGKNRIHTDFMGES